MKTKLQNLVNHISFVIDKSSSMESLSEQVVRVFDGQIKSLQRKSKELDQETRVSVYFFNENVECIAYDMDCLRMPSLKGLYKAYGWTALLDGFGQAIEDLKKTPELYGDHAMLVIGLTDGDENRSRKYNAKTTETLLKNLPDHWTVAVYVPNQMGAHYCKGYGIPANNISVWDVSAKGLDEVEGKMSKTIDNYMAQRATGVRGTKNLFELDTSKISSEKVRAKLKALSPNDYMLIPVHKDSVIKPFVESWTQKPYQVGSTYYQLTKPEKVQSYKQLALKNKISGKVYAGTEARKMLGLPDYEVKVSPTHLDGYDVFISSTSLNRKLISGSQCLVILN